jgi:hypothetical protein
MKPIVTAKNHGYFSFANRRILIIGGAVGFLQKNADCTAAVQAKASLVGLSPAEICHVEEW